MEEKMEDKGQASGRRRVIVAKEKHEKRMLEATTDEAWAQSALALLTERFNDGYWYNDPSSDKSEWTVKKHKERSELLEMKEEVIAALPEFAQEDMRRKIASARRDAAEDAKELQQYLRIKQVVESQDLSWIGKNRGRQPWAWALLMARTEYEYEGVGLSEIEAPKIEEVSL